MPQLKMTPELERFARTGAKLEIAREIAEQRQRHRDIDKRFPGVLAEALHAVRANGRAIKAAPVKEEAPKRTMSADARRRISLAQKRRWRNQKKEAAKAG